MPNTLSTLNLNARLHLRRCSQSQCAIIFAFLNCTKIQALIGVGAVCAKHTPDPKSELPSHPRSCSQLACAVMCFIMNCCKIQALICARTKGAAWSWDTRIRSSCASYRTRLSINALRSIYFSFEHCFSLPFRVCVCLRMQLAKASEL